MIWNPEYKAAGQNGWICPKCGRVYAPWVQYCPNCISNTVYTTTTTPVWVYNADKPSTAVKVDNEWYNLYL